MVLNQDYESDEDMKNEWEIVSDNVLQEDQQSLLDNDSNQLIAEETSSSIENKAKIPLLSTMSKKQSKAIDNSSDQKNDGKNNGSIAESSDGREGTTPDVATTPLISEVTGTLQILENDSNEKRTSSNGKKKKYKQKTKISFNDNNSSIAESSSGWEDTIANTATTPAIEEATVTPQMLENDIDKTRTSTTEKAIQDKKIVKLIDEDTQQQQKVETTMLKEEAPRIEEENNNTPTPKRLPFFVGAAQRLFKDTAIDIKNKHKISTKTKNSLRTVETSAQYACQTIGDAVIDIDKKHQVRKRTNNSFIGKSVRNVGQKIGGTVTDIDKKHQSCKIAGSSLKAFGTSARDFDKRIGSEMNGSARIFGREIGSKTNMVKDHVKRVYIEKNVEKKAKDTAEKIKTATKKAGQKARHFNEEHRVVEVLGTAVIVGAGLFYAIF